MKRFKYYYLEDNDFRTNNAVYRLNYENVGFTVEFNKEALNAFETIERV